MGVPRAPLRLHETTWVRVGEQSLPQARPVGIQPPQEFQRRLQPALHPLRRLPGKDRVFLEKRPCRFPVFEPLHKGCEPLLRRRPGKLPLQARHVQLQDQRAVQHPDQPGGQRREEHPLRRGRIEERAAAPGGDLIDSRAQALSRPLEDRGQKPQESSDGFLPNRFGEGEGFIGARSRLRVGRAQLGEPPRRGGTERAKSPDGHRQQSGEGILVQSVKGQPAREPGALCERGLFPPGLQSVTGNFGRIGIGGSGDGGGKQKLRTLRQGQGSVPVHGVEGRVTHGCGALIKGAGRFGGTHPPAWDRTFPSKDSSGTARKCRCTSSRSFELRY